jgi:branched-chain amino acid transport system ATP-binding protein
MSLLETLNLNGFYEDEYQVLYDMNIKLEQNTIVGIVGANASGKTSTLRAISGTLNKTTGNINFAGLEISHLPPYQRAASGLVQIPEGRQLFPFMTVLENLEMGAYAPHARTDRRKTLEWVFTLFPTLRDRKEQLGGSLSGGEQQMCAIARGLMARPKLLMFDEPSLGLAPKMVAACFDVIAEINRQGVSILLVEQNVLRALSIAKTAYVLENGVIVMSGKGKELLTNQQLRKAYMGI